ncbi:MAG: diaminopimelate epimerase [Alphaproteobacteria bacterium]|nr:diaminopimelate epimerase [Alphaproteobacteria bacterium]
MKFTKMHGLGNDYVYIDGYAYPKAIDNAEDLAKYFSLSHIGIGSDGVIFVLPPKDNKNDFQMRIFNSDGSEGKMCGNGIRCVGKYVYDNGLTTSKKLRIETLSGVKHLTLFTDEDNQVSAVQVNMGKVEIKELTLLKILGRLIEGYCVNVGNPHFVVLPGQIKATEVNDFGKAIENDACFAPERTNVEFIEPAKAKDALRVRVWERGSGRTMACGTGACASFAVANHIKMVSDNAKVILDGGELSVSYDKNKDVLMAGPATTVFTAEITDKQLKQIARTQQVVEKTRE